MILKHFQVDGKLNNNLWMKHTPSFPFDVWLVSDISLTRVLEAVVEENVTTIVKKLITLIINLVS